MKKITNSGFTLIELIITVAIMGVITIIAFPAIISLQNSNKIVKYEAYADSLGSNARVYINNFYKDVFPELKDGCFVVNYNMLLINDLIKEIDVDDVSCRDSFVKVTLSGGKYTYETSISCINESGEEVYKMPKDELDISMCLVENDGPPKIEIISPDNTSSKNSHDFSINVFDYDTLFENVEIKYAWARSNDSNSLLENDFVLYKYNNNYGVAEVSLESSTSELLKEYSENRGEIYDPNGVWYLHVKASGDSIETSKVVDADDNKKDPSEIIYDSFNLDNSGPDAPSIYNPTNGNWTNKDFALELTINESCDNISNWRYSYDGVSWKYYEDLEIVGSSDNSCTVETTDFSKERDENVYISVCDKSGNCSDSSDTPIKIDKTKPSDATSQVKYDTSAGTIRSNSLTTFTNRTLWWGNFSGTDNASGINRYEYSTNCTGNVSNILNSTGYTYSNNTNYKFCIRSVDNAGNYSGWSSPTYIKVDKTAPKCTVTGGSSSWVNRNLTLTGTCSDTGGSGCKTNVTKSFTAGSGNYSPGSVSDNAGNVTQCGTNPVYIDKIAPTCSVSGGNSSWTTAARTIVGTCSDTGGSGCTGNASLKLTNANGWYSPGIVRDKAGNSTTCSKTTLYIDGTIPPAPIFESVVNIRNYVPLASINYNDCIGKGGKYANESCNVYFHVGNYAGISFSLKRSAANPGAGYQVSYEQNKWTHAYPGSVGYCDFWFTESSGHCSDWRQAPCANYARCSSVASWGTHCVRSVDTAGRGGYSLCVTYHYQWGK